MAGQLEQLLTCCICLDRFRNPKLLPCQHSVCMEPCMEGLVDYVRRQVKCPECRAEHRIPYNGVQGFPANVTLQRFLEAHIEITGETPDPHTGQIMERCNVCNEKNYLSVCAHCEKKICVDCKSAHGDILKREIGRINNQVKRAVHRLTDQLRVIDRNITALKQNSDNVTEEIDQITKRLQKALRDRCDFLKSEIENYYQSEHRNLTHLKSGLEQEISNVNSNIELAEKHMDDNTPWDDGELMDCKDIFLRTMDFIRAFDYEPGGEYSRRAKFNTPEEINRLASSLASLGELKIEPSRQQGMESFGAGSSLQGGIMKSKSDHRLAVAFRDQEESGYGHSESRRRFGERPPVVEAESSYDSPSESSGRRRFKSRFIHHDNEEKTVNFKDDEPTRTRPKIIDTEDVSRGPLSGITRMFDSPRVLQRLQERDSNAKKKKDEPPKPPAATPAAKTPVTFGTPPKKTARQISEDEIDKIKKQNKSDAATPSPAAASGNTRPPLERLTSLKDEDRSGRGDRGSVSPRSSTHSPSKYEDNSGTHSPSRKPSVDTSSSLNRTTFPYSRSSSTSSVGDASKTPTSKTGASSRQFRSDSTDSNKSGNGSISPKKASGAAFSADELKNRFQKTNNTTSSVLRPDSSASKGASSGSSRYDRSRFLGRAGTPSVDLSKELASEEVEEEEEETSEESDSEETEESSDEEEEDDKDTKIHSSRVDTGILLGRNAQNRDSSSTKGLVNGNSYGANSSSNDSGYSSRSRYGTSTTNDTSNSRYGGSSTSTNSGSSYRRPSYLETNKSKEKEDDHDSKYSFTSRYARNKDPPAEEETKSPFQSRFLNKSKSSALLGPDSALASDDDSSPPAGSSRARFEELKKQRLARSKSSAGVDEEETPTSPTESSSVGSAASRYGSRYGNDTSANTTANSTSRTSGSSNAASGAADDGNGAQLSNWARYLKNKYGNTRSTSNTNSTPETNGVTSSTARIGTGTSSILGKTSLGSGAGTSTSSARQSALSRSRSSHLLGLAKDDEKTEDDSSKNVHATPISLAAVDTQPPPIVPPIGNIHRNQYLQKQLLLLKIGSRGSEPGCFTWPRGIAVGPDSTIVVADSSNHRVQVFDNQGNYLKDFGSYGNGEGEFDCLAGVTVNRIGQYIIADRYNHRVQIFDPSGMFLRSFGSQGSSDGKFSYPWGVTTDSLGYIYVCDKENHRIQVFQADGTFVGKFGSYGTGVGQLQHPHYIAVSSTNRVIVSDSNNHRVQIFDVNGKFISSFGSEGSEDGQFKYPRGVAVDEQGYIFLADSGNNRIQIFQSDGTFLRTFGCWGSESGEFKGLEGVAVMSNGNILVCDRENHRIQMF